MGRDSAWGYRNFPAENAVAVGASRLIAISPSAKAAKGMAATPPLWIPGLRLETLSAMDTPHRLE